MLTVTDHHAFEVLERAFQDRRVAKNAGVE